jgi:predicted ATPase/DNA-binding winged helix-turn-helix (wHTH) protein
MSRLDNVRIGFCFGPFVLDQETGELFEDGQFSKRLSPQGRTALLLLIQRSGKTVTREELQTEIWGKQTIPPQWGLENILGRLRKDLHDPNGQRYIEILPRVGVRFVCPVESLGALDSDPIRAADEGELPDVDERGVVGRSGDVEQICSKLLTGRSRLLSLVGEGGVGKTTLALIIRQRVRNNFAGGVWFVKLSGLRSPDHLASDIAGELGLSIVREQLHDTNITPEERERRNEELAENALVNHFTKIERLLILDNCEHLGGAPGVLVETLLRRCAKIWVIATSRCPLDLLGLESPIVVLPLAHRLRAGATVADVLALPSIQLFLRRAGLSDDDAKALGKNFIAKLRKLARRLEGVPLCIVLAAARYRLTSNIDAIFNDLIRALSIQDPRLEPKAKAVRASIQWSERLLSPAARDLLYRLSVFYGGWDDRALAEVCIATTTEDSEALDAQVELERNFLIVPDGTRHRMNPVVREYAFDRLKSTGQADNILRDHAEYYARIAHEQGQKVVRRNMKSAMRLLAADSQNFKRAFDWCRAHNAKLGLGLATSLWQYWVVKGLFSFGRGQLEEFLSDCPDETPAMVCRALAGSAILAYFQSDYSSALDLAERCLLQAKKNENIWAQVTVLVVASIAEIYQPKPDHKAPGLRARAIQYLDKSVKLADGQSSAYWLQALAHSNRAFLLAQIDAQRRRSGWRKLLAEAKAAVRAARRTQNEWIIDVALVNEAFTIWEAHPSPDRASVEDLLKIALKSRHDIGDRYGILQIFGLLAHVICTAKDGREEDYRRAAILLGIQDAMQDQKELPIPALNNKAINAARDVLRTKLASEMDTLWSHARERMSQKDALQFALGELNLDWRAIIR